MADTVYMGLGNPLGYFWVERRENGPGWHWEARRDGWHVDAGVTRTRRGAIRQAKRALAEENRGEY